MAKFTEHWYQLLLMFEKNPTRKRVSWWEVSLMHLWFSILTISAGLQPFKRKNMSFFAAWAKQPGFLVEISGRWVLCKSDWGRKVRFWFFFHWDKFLFFSFCVWWDETSWTLKFKSTKAGRIKALHRTCQNWVSVITAGFSAIAKYWNVWVQHFFTEMDSCPLSFYEVQLPKKEKQIRIE